MKRRVPMNRRLEWSSVYAIGIDSLDTDHAELLGRINRLEEAVAEGADMATLDAHMTGLREACRVHFAVEEEMMADLTQPPSVAHRETHQARHQGFLRSLDEVRANLKAEGRLEIGDLDAVYLIEELVRLDFDMVRCLIDEKGVAWAKETGIHL